MPPTDPDSREPLTGAGGTAAFVDGTELYGDRLVGAVRSAMEQLPVGSVVAVTASSVSAGTTLEAACRASDPSGTDGVLAEVIAAFVTDRGPVVMLRRSGSLDVPSDGAERGPPRA